MTSAPRKMFSFARMMVLAQRRHAAKLAAREALQAVQAAAAASRAEAARRTLQKMNGTKRLVAFMYPA
ncbi:MAG: hypothetical protein KF891_11125 [Rhizobacter sp.]|nr:hypothetical protein [Rhizobacter sp.]